MNDAVQLALGSAQFGLAYGVAGRGAPVPADEVRAILAAAWDGGIRLVDTAPVYGDIEPRLLGLAQGREFSFVSKIPALPVGIDADAAGEFVSTSIGRSRSRLGAGLRSLLFHRGDDLADANGAAVWNAAQRAVAGAGIELGGSFYSPAAAIAARTRFPIAVAQLPGNALDQRLGAHGASLGGVAIHLRSVFLQGLLLMPLTLALERVPRAERPLGAWVAWCAERSMTPLAAALGIAKALPGVTHCLVGVDRESQLAEILAAWHSVGPIELPELACPDDDVIDPRRWAA